MRVYEKVRAYIDEMCYKQVTIAEKAGIPKATFNAILNGKRTLYTPMIFISPFLSTIPISTKCASRSTPVPWTLRRRLERVQA